MDFYIRSSRSTKALVGLLPVSSSHDPLSFLSSPGSAFDNAPTDLYYENELHNSLFQPGVNLGPTTANMERQIIIAQAVIAAFFVLAGIIIPLFPRRPQWCTPFAQEEAETCLRIRWTFWNLCLVVTSAAGFAIALTSLLLPPYDLFSVLYIIPWAAAALITVIQRPKKTPASLLMLYISMTVCHLALLECSRRSLLQPVNWFLVATTFVCALSITTILRMPMRDPALSRYGIAETTPTSDLRSPEDNITLWQFMTVTWMAPLIAQGCKRKLDAEDVWRLPYEFQHGKLHLLFGDLHGSIMKRLLLANGLDLIIISFLGALESAANLSVPILLKRLLESIQGGPTGKDNSLFFAVSILVVRLVASQSSVFTLWYSRRCYERSRGEMITTLYAKTLTRKSFGESSPAGDGGDSDDGSETESGSGSGSDDMVTNGCEPPPKSLTSSRLFGWLSFFFRRKESRYQKIGKDKSKKAKQPATTGKILNLMRNDVYEVAQRFWDFPQLITKPLQFVVSFALVWKLLGWPCLMGLACVALAQTLNTVVIKKLLDAERRRRGATDERLHATSQFVEGIRHLRWYDWQSKWLDRIMGTRQHELDVRVTAGLWRIAISTINVASGAMFPVATFFAYTFIAGRTLPVEVAFPALQLFTMLESSFKELPALIMMLLNAFIAMDRIEQFMDEPDVQDDGDPADHTTIDMIEFCEASFAWPGLGRPVLRDLDLAFPKGLTVVFGKVGAGKTALLQGILGELDSVSGDFTIPNAAVGYCAQLPWLQHMSIRDNILFSAPYDPERYSRVLDACALLPDLASFKHGDLSDIGENGIGLSGGQRARVALARAIYSHSSVLLLDDPLAALDHHTAESIVRKLFRGPLIEGRTVVLVTHRVDLCLHLADQMVEIDDGRARVLDTEEAAREIAKFLRDEELRQEAHQSEEEEEEEEDQDRTPGDSDNEGSNEVLHSAAIRDKFVEDEHRRDGGVMFSVYWTYIKAGMLRLWALLIIVFGLYRCGSLLSYWFLKAWGEAYRPTEEEAFFSPGSSSFVSRLFDHLPNPNSDLQPWLLTYMGIALGQTIIFTISEGLLLVMIYQAAKSLFRRVIDRVSCATFRFYDVTPVGRLMNRLVSDIGMIDGGIMAPLQQVAWWALAWISSMVVIASVTPIFLIFSVGMTIWFAYIFMRFLPTSQSLRRLEMVSLSPLMSNFGILLDGLATIRAFNAQHHFQNKNIAVTDAFQQMDHFYWSLQAWLMYRFDALSAFSTFALTLLALYKGLSPGLTAFVLTTASQFVEATHNLCRQYGTLQMDFVSVERVIELLYLPKEPQGEIEPPSTWPSEKDDIVFDKVTLKYAQHLDPSLSDVSFRIPGGSTCAVLGRTGSGKSTLALALLATMHPSEGTISIGNINLAEVDVHKWRQRISFVAQDPVLFPGTLRENLDPLQTFTDEECLTILRRVLGPGWDLLSPIEGGGKNLSQGQRQLVGIGRAVLRRSPVVILDEATASIDKETAGRVQEILREELRTSTVITIAHRLEAVEGADYCIRLEGGRVVECGRTGEKGGG